MNDAHNNSQNPNTDHPLVGPGAELHCTGDDGQSMQLCSQAQIGIDWLRFTIPKELHLEVINRMEACFGLGTRRSPQLGYTEGIGFGKLANVFSASGQRNEVCGEMTGLGCRRTASHVLLQWIGWVLDNNGRITRIDICLDFLGQSADIIQKMEQAYDAGEVCKLRHYEGKVQRSSSSEPAGKLVQFGRRGAKGAGAMVRIYDKAVDTGTTHDGPWTRWETEFSQHKASRVGQQLVSVTDWRREAAGCALNVVDVRENNGQAAHARRPRVNWWQELIAGIEHVTVDASKPNPAPDGTLQWASNVASTFWNVSRECDLPVEQVIERLIRPIHKAAPVVHTPASLALCAFLKQEGAV